MARRPAGKRYPHITTDARPHDHRWCPVAAAIASRAQAGKEQWGTRHDFPAVATRAEAEEIRHGLFRARDCKQLRAEGGPEISVHSGYDTMSDGTFAPYVMVYLRSQAKAEIVRRVKAGEPLVYNPMRSKA